MIAVETILTVGLGFLILLWVGIRFRKGGRWFKEKGLFGIALVLIIVGTALLTIAFLTNKLGFLNMFVEYIQLNIKIGTILLIAGSVCLILDQLYRTWKKEQKLGIEHERIHSLVIFWGDCKFKTAMPENVCKGGIFNRKFKQFIQSKNEVVFSLEEINKIQSDLTRLKENSGLFSSLQHAKDVRNRYKSTRICPKCGGDLIERVSNKGQRIGKSFLGCSNYPRCKYIKDI